MGSFRKVALSIFVSVVFVPRGPAQQASPSLHLNDKEYFEMPGLNVMVFQDIYPEGHQAGVSIIQNGQRVATNGDLRSGPYSRAMATDGQAGQASARQKAQRNFTTLSYPDPDRNRTGYNPIDYPDLNFAIKFVFSRAGRKFVLS